MEWIDMYVDKEYVNGVYDSCKEVVFPSSGGLAITFSCGTTLCSPEKWYKYMYNPANGVTPFLVNLIYENGPRTWTAETKKCYESYPNSRPCSYVDCSGHIPVGNMPVEEIHTEMTFFSIVLCALLVLFFSVATTVIVIFRFPAVWIPKWLAGTAKFDVILSKGFRAWAKCKCFIWLNNLIESVFLHRLFFVIFLMDSFHLSTIHYTWDQFRYYIGFKCWHILYGSDN